MTDEEQATSIGRLAQTYSQAKAKRAALLATAVGPCDDEQDRR